MWIVEPKEIFTLNAKEPNNTAAVCPRCRRNKFPYQKLISAVKYQEPLVNIIHLFKYKHYDYLGDFLASLIIKHIENIGFAVSYYDMLCPVPMHILKLKERRYNHASFLGEKVANHFKISLRNDIIYARINAPSQTKFNGKERKQNIKGAFAVKEEIKNKKIIIFDDIFTTGSTIKECACALRKQEAGEIAVITLCRS